MLRLLTLIAIFSSAALADTSAKFTLTSSGKPKAEIVVANEHPELPLTFAAEELQRYVKKMSGAELPIVHASSGKSAIILETRSLQKTAEDPCEEDHYRLNVDKKKIQITGATSRAVLFGVYDLLERLGCGWCVPGDDSVPKSDTLQLPALDIDTRPAFQYRKLVEFPMESVAQSMALADWLAKNRMNWIHPAPNAMGEPKLYLDRRDRVLPEYQKRGLHINLGGHTMHTWVPLTYFDAHPEWFALNDGQRKGPTLCVSNLEMTAELVKNMRAFLDRCPEVEIVDLWHPDAGVSCHCPVCTRGLVPESAKGKTPEGMTANAVPNSYIISYVELINRVAEAIAKSHPKVLLSALMYNPTSLSLPDDCPAFADNVIVGLAQICRDSFMPIAGEPRSQVNERYLGIDFSWIAKSKHSYIYEYYNDWYPPYIYPGSQVIVRDLQIMRELGVQGSSSDLYGYSPENMYVGARAMWSPSIDWKDALRDFANRFYGDVGKEMGEAQIRLETGIYGLPGYLSGDAMPPEAGKYRAPAGAFLEKQRPGQIALIKSLIEKTKDAQVKVRLERQLKPWVLWNEDPRWWAFPEFKDTK